MRDDSRMTMLAASKVRKWRTLAEGPAELIVVPTGTSSLSYKTVSRQRPSFRFFSGFRPSFRLVFHHSATVVRAVAWCTCLCHTERRLFSLRASCMIPVPYIDIFILFNRLNSIFTDYRNDTHTATCKLDLESSTPTCVHDI